MGTLRSGPPQAAGFDPSRLERTYQILADWSQQEKIPGAVIAIGRRGLLIGPHAFGQAAWQPQPIPLHATAIYDLASLTKVVATTTGALLLLERGYLRLNDAVSFFLPDFIHEQITLRHLLTHTSGLAAWHPLYKTKNRAEMMTTLLQLPLVCQTGTRVIYSCLGYILLAQVIERLAGKSLAQFAQEEIFLPLKMHDTGYLLDEKRRKRAIPTEEDPATGLFRQGVVHDENAFALGGVSGNAGLFSTARDLAIFAQLQLNGGLYGDRQLLAPATVDLATQNHTQGLGAARGLGWAIKGDDHHCSAGDLFSPRSFGHTGFTGTSLWIDPERDLFLVLLTNGIHPTRARAQHLRLRPLIANTVIAALCG